MTTLRFETVIRAPRERVWRTMLDPDTYRIWTAEFAPGSYYEGSWDQGASIRFLGPGGDGMIAEIEESRPFEYVSIHHLGEIRQGEQGASGEPAKAWPGDAFERYTLREAEGVTDLEVACDVTPEYEAMFNEMWPRALQRLKALVETGG